MARTLTPCGTRTAYNRHLRRGETPDDACRKANSERVLTDPRFAARQRARQRACTRLTHTYATAWDEIFTEELAREGEATDRRAARARARQRAFARISRQRPEAFATLLAEELAKETTR